MDLAGGRGKAMFTVQNLKPETQTLTVTCLYNGPDGTANGTKIYTDLVQLTPTIYKNEKSDNNVVELGRDDPTLFSCIIVRRNNVMKFRTSPLS